MVGVIIATVAALLYILSSLNDAELATVTHVAVTTVIAVLCSGVFFVIGNAVGKRQERNLSSIMRASERNAALPQMPVMPYTMWQQPPPPAPVAPYGYARPLSQSQGGYRQDYAEAQTLDWGDL
jgi:hypothetical protein